MNALSTVFKFHARTAFMISLLAALICSGAFAQNPSSVINVTQRPARVETRVFVRSKSLLVHGAVVEDKLMKRPEFSQLNLAITRDEAAADIILELRHDLLTKYVYSAVDTRTNTVVAGGKVSSLGGTVAGKVAKRFCKQLQQGHP